MDALFDLVAATEGHQRTDWSSAFVPDEDGYGTKYHLECLCGWEDNRQTQATSVDLTQIWRDHVIEKVAVAHLIDRKLLERS